MSKHTPLNLPKDPEAHAAVLSRWAEALNTRLREIETLHSAVQAQLDKLIKDNSLVK